MSEAAAAMNGELIQGRADSSWSGAALDSRRIAGGELFFALAGERTDGHRFVPQAFERGASAAVVSQGVEVPEGHGVIRVDDTFAALHRLTRDVRSRVPRNLVAVTGSIGKTTTKEILATLLGRCYRVAKNPGSLNNLYGFPVALLGIPEDTEWMVAEMGMSTPGELGGVSRLGRPDVALFTNVRPAHLEAFGSLRAIAEAKAELLEGLSDSGLVVANRDDPEIVRFVARHPGPVEWFAIDHEARYRTVEIAPNPSGIGSRFLFVADNVEVEIELPLHGLYNVDNFLAAAACAHALGVSLEDISVAALDVQEQPMRGVVHRLGRGCTIIDDCYNSNPAALERALRSAARLEGRRHWAVLGDMLELGESAGYLHRQAGRQAAELGFDPVLGVGELARELVSAAADAGVVGRWFENAETAAEGCADELSAGDVVLIKGSRGVGLEVVVGAMLAVDEEAS